MYERTESEKQAYMQGWQAGVDWAVGKFSNKLYDMEYNIKNDAKNIMGTITSTLETMQETEDID